jgi:integrase
MLGIWFATQWAEGNLSFDQASAKGRELVAKVRRSNSAEGHALAETVRSIISTYVEIRDARHNATRGEGRRRRSDASSRLTRHVLNDQIADTKLITLTEEALRGWKARCSPSANASSRIRTISDFKAALNLAHQAYRTRLPDDFADIVRFGLSRDETLRISGTKRRDNQILPDDTVRDIIAAAAAADEEGDFGRMVLILAATGARFSQVQRIKVGDVQPKRLRIFVPVSRKGQGKGDEHYVVQVGQDIINAFAPVVMGRGMDEPLLCRWRLVQVKGREWRRDRRGAWTSASEMTRPWKSICGNLGLEGVIPYALRHSSIVRAGKLSSHRPAMIVAFSRLLHSRQTKLHNASEWPSQRRIKSPTSAF